MDMFMDKLAQKLTAQEIIKANTAADVEELNKLKNQIAEYNECLGKLQKLIDDGFGKLSGIHAEDGEIGRLVRENSEGTKVLRRDVADFQKSLGQLEERLDSLEKGAAEQMETWSASAEERLDSLSASVTEQSQSLTEAVTGQVAFLTVSMGERIDSLCGQLEAQANGGISERLEAMEENVHKECVKVYRNVQAVMVEESGKQGAALDEAKAGVADMRGKLGTVLGISVAAMILSLAGIAIQILSGLRILPF